MNRLTLTGVFTLFGALSILAPSLAEPPTPTATPMSDAELERETRRMTEMALNSMSPRRDASDPSLDDPITISKREWQIMQVKINLLMLQSEGSLSLIYRVLGNPGPEAEAFSSDAHGFWYWQFVTANPDERSLVVNALAALSAITDALPGMHVNAHSLVVEMPGRDGKLTKRYITFDSDEFGDLLPPHISVSPPRMSSSRRKEIASMFEARASLRKQWHDCNESLSKFTNREEWIERHGKCDELQERYQLVKGMIPGTGGLFVLMKEAVAAMVATQTSPRRVMDSAGEERHEADVDRRARKVSDVPRRQR